MRTKRTKLDPRREGELLHAKHAFPPNSLGYCGPDVRGRIEDYLHKREHGKDLVPVLTKFEAAYPFLKMIAKSTGRDPFDYRVAEAYWLGNSLLDYVQPPDFFEFTHKDLSYSRKMVGKSNSPKKEEVKSIFKDVGPIAKPHHTFYVLGIYARSSIRAGTEGLLLELMDSCRISWGKVLELRHASLIVERPSLELKNGVLSLGLAARKEIKYDPEISPFANIRKGDWVSVHWNFASEKLMTYQLRNLELYTKLDIKAANKLAASKAK